MSELMENERRYKEAHEVYEAFYDEYGLDPGFSILVLRPLDMKALHVMTIIGQEHRMPELPKTCRGFTIERSKTRRPVLLGGATR